MSLIPTKRKATSALEESATTSPIVFYLATHPPDVKLRIFDDVEFHVHSSRLKENSAFFQKFLDSPDKQIPLTGPWKYEWVSCIDADGSWSLVDIRKAPKSSSSWNRLKGEESFHQAAFHKFIGIFYNPIWPIDNMDEFTLIVHMADYYRALPLVSSSLPGTLFKSHKFASTFKDANQRDLLSLAVKLRSPELFRDCMTLISGDTDHGALWDESGNLQRRNFGLEDMSLNALATDLRVRLYERIIRTNILISHTILRKVQSVINGLAPPIVNPAQPKDITALQVISSELDGKDHLFPSYYINFQYTPYITPIIKQSIAALTRSDLRLCPLKQMDSQFRGRYFLCSDIKDEDIPWDASVTIW